MKKALFASVILLALTVTKSFAQDKVVSKGPELSIGVDGGIPVGDFKEGWKFGIGGTAKFAYNFDENVAITLQSGYISFSGKTFDGEKNPSLGFIPIKVGGRYTFPGGFFIEPQLGVTNINKGIGTKFTYAGNLGYRMTPGIDVSARYEGISASGGNLSFIGFRVAYSFPFGSK